MPCTVTSPELISLVVLLGSSAISSPSGFTPTAFAVTGFPFLVNVISLPTVAQRLVYSFNATGESFKSFLMNSSSMWLSTQAKNLFLSK